GDITMTPAHTSQPPANGTAPAPPWHAGQRAPAANPPGDRPADPRYDPSVAHPARVYNYWLGGKDHGPPDREAGRVVMDQRPEVVAGAGANRRFLARVVRPLAAGPG